MLKDLRKKVAKKHDLPPFVIFQDPSLEDMYVQYPVTLEEMQNITGVGAGKARRFGAEFVKLIKAYVEEKEIIRPQDMVVKGVASKSGNKIFIIQSIDRKMDFEDIARAPRIWISTSCSPKSKASSIRVPEARHLLLYPRSSWTRTRPTTSTSISGRTPRAIRSMLLSRSWAPTIPRRRYACTYQVHLRAGQLAVRCEIRK